MYEQLVIRDSATVKRYYSYTFEAMKQDSRTYLAKLWDQKARSSYVGFGRPVL